MHRGGWVLYALLATVILVALLTDAGGLQRVAQALAAPALLLVLLSAVPLRTRTAQLTALALLLAGFGDQIPAFTTQPRAVAAGFFLAALTVYAVALAPLWWRGLDALRLLLVVPYGAVLLGLFLACAGGAGPLLPLLIPYSLALGAVAFLSAGVNAPSWVGGTLLMLSSSVLGMSWFLPGAWLPQADLLVMLTYLAGQALLVLGLLRTIPGRRWTRPEAPGGSRLVIQDVPEPV